MTARFLISLLVGLSTWSALAETVDGGGDLQLPKPETEAQTIAKCERDARSESPEIRRRAMMVLGKYKNPTADAILVNALNDSDAQVRLAALVSLTEENFLPSNQARRVLDMLGDENVHIRRIVSSILPQLVMGTTRFAAFRARPPSPAPDSEKIKSALLKAFSDPDDVVRKNMVNHYSSVSSLLDPNVLIPLLRDENRDVRSLALKNALRHLKPERLPDLAALAKDPDRLIRLNLAKGLVNEGGPGAAAILERMIDDSDDEVRSRAILGLLRRRRFNDLQRIEELLNNPTIDSNLGEQIIYALGHLKEKPSELTRRLMKHERPAYRAAALRVHSFGGGSTPLTVEEMKSFLDDESADVRLVAAQFLSRPGRIAPDTIDEMLESPHDEVRGALLNVARRFNEDDAADLLMDLLLDESRDIREQALSEYGRRRLPGWRDVLAQSLEDDDPAIRRAAVNLLMFSADEKAFSILRKHASEIDDPQTKSTIEFFLRRGAVTKPPTIRQHPIKKK